jgi:hypothetical protein
MLAPLTVLPHLNHLSLWIVSRLSVHHHRLSSVVVGIPSLRQLHSLYINSRLRLRATNDIDDATFTTSCQKFHSCDSDDTWISSYTNGNSVQILIPYLALPKLESLVVGDGQQRSQRRWHWCLYCA